MEYNHAMLVMKAARWLRSQHHSLVLTEFVSGCEEIPDAIGWGPAGSSTLIEVKVSRSDFLSDCRSKRFRVDPACGVGEYRYFLAPTGVIHPQDLESSRLAQWGLLRYDQHDRVTVQRPAMGQRYDHRAEIAMLCTALGRVKVRIRPMSLKTFFQAAGVNPLYMIREGHQEPLFRLLDCKHQSIKEVGDDLWCLRCGSPLRRVDGQLEITV